MRKKKLLISIFVLFSSAILSAQSTESEIKTDSVSIYSKIAAKHLDSIFQIQKEQHEQRKRAIEDYKKKVHGNEDSEYALMSKIEKNTYVDFYKDGWTLLAIVTLAFSFFTFLAQYYTEKHTKNVSISSQEGQLKDIPRHFYRNLVCTLAMLLKYRDESNLDKNKFKSYPSEANMLKLQTLPEEFLLNIDIDNDRVFKVMHEEKILFKNYNIEVDIASKHFARKDIMERSITNDIDNIMYKPLFLISESFKLRKEIDICKSKKITEFFKRYKVHTLRFFTQKANSDTHHCEELYLAETIYTFVETHFSKLKFGRICSDAQYNMFKKIYKDLNTYIECGGKNGLQRSYEDLFKINDKKKPNDTLFLKWLNGKCYIDKSAFLEYFHKKQNRRKEKTSSEETHILDTILNASSIKELYAIYQITDSRYKECAKAYFNLWRQDLWEAKSLIYNILVIDSIKELPIIGMIDHES